MYEFAHIRTRVASHTVEKRYDVRASEKIFYCGDLVWLYNLACVASALGGRFGTGEVWNGES